ncbi:flagellar basal body rod protein FlgC (plasmid) [Pontibacillus sp. ALD_SL1]|uniref:flagellar basal body rod C-terminal domain-containing protein n=1 Tax=Pontibacillus sp. ALD_SL1 TaxID=2777185 RepID=UPI001A970A4C|nr:flagellar basal body rod C-terminal domain-containing protein [Pontibacillus sp. ALD_SL1]QST03030.1 flagellar basal body rod protein FlgC [Pontibacillus sp. ALD_SL1]
MGDLLSNIGSSLTGNKMWMETITNNITNMNTTRTENGGPYKRQTVLFKDVLDGVQVKKITVNDSVKTVFNPNHPDANKEGYVNMPAIDLTAEITNLMQSQKGYQASVTALNAEKKVIEKTSTIGQN